VAMLMMTMTTMVHIVGNDIFIKFHV